MSRYALVFLVLFAVRVCAVEASNAVAEAVLQTRGDIRTGMAELTALREMQASERVPLAEELSILQREVAALREEAERLRLLRGRDEKARQAIRAETQSLVEECRFLETLFQEYRRALETRASTAEMAWLTPRLDAVDAAWQSDEAYASLPGAVAALLALGQDWNEVRIGGYVFGGTALNADGVEVQGTFAAAGPAAWFVANDGSVAGLAVTEPGFPEAQIYTDTEHPLRKGIARLVQGQEVALPVDVSAGDALKVREADAGFLAKARQGGFVMIPLLITGVLALVLALVKALSLWRLCVRDEESVRAVLDGVKAGAVCEAEQRAQQLPRPLDTLVRVAIRHRGASREQLEEMLHEQVLSLLPELERHLGTLAVLGGIAPLLGLLGTVTGMIHTFQLVTVFGSGDARLLSGGISEALITTEFGLMIAIPVLLAHAFLSRRARRITGALEQSAVAMVNQLKADEA
jgi:biopolymer transport protein ExbB